MKIFTDILAKIDIFIQIISIITLQARMLQQIVHVYQIKSISYANLYSTMFICIPQNSCNGFVSVKQQPNKQSVSSLHIGIYNQNIHQKDHCYHYHIFVSNNYFITTNQNASISSSLSSQLENPTTTITQILQNPCS
ncbi:unnamed protein product [Paramecium sonneborni]|uniref:Uncharacterized protein n=1 Tax=Paramecium sonneborni TaxID=65129 RepID=A0A8S1RNK3_9CILI|nr:unnamed protein product [Paramecium sonneborni]